MASPMCSRLFASSYYLRNARPIPPREALRVPSMTLLHGQHLNPFTTCSLPPCTWRGNRSVKVVLPNLTHALYHSHILARPE